MGTRIRLRWWWVLPAAIALAVGLYALAGYWLAPKLVRSQAVDFVSSELGKPLSLGAIRIDPFQLRLEADDIRIDDEGRPLVSARRLVVDLSLSTLWTSGYVLDSVALDTPYARAIVRQDGSLNLAELVPESSEPEAPLPEVSIVLLEVAAGHVDFADHSRSARPEKKLAPITFRLEDFHTTGTGSNFRLSAVSERDERFRWAGKLSLQPLASEGDIVVAGLQAHTLQSFADDQLPFELADGQVDLSIGYRFGAARGTGLQLDATVPQVTLRSLALRARGEAQDRVTIPEAVVENTRLSWARRSVTIEAVRATGLQTRLQLQPDGSLDIARLFAEPASPGPPSPGTALPGTVAQAPATASPEQAWTVTVSRLSLERGRVEFQDHTVRPAATFRLEPVALTMESLGLDLDKAVPLSMQATINGVAPLSMTGTIVPASSAATLQLELARLPLHDVGPYLPALAAMRIDAGAVSAEGTLSLRPEGASEPGIEFSGSGAVDNFSLVGAGNGGALVSWTRAAADGLRYTAGPDAVSIRTLSLKAPHARVAILPDQSINLVNAMGEQAPTASGRGLPIEVARVVLDNGRLGFSDLSIDPGFSADILGLRGTLLGLSTHPGQVAKIDLKGHLINRHSPVEIAGETDVSAFDRHTDVRLAFRNIELPIFNPYSGRFAGYSIAKGKLTTELHYRIDERALLADHHVVVDQLEWGAPTDSKDKVTLPVRLATALLKDRNGVIDLALPVTGTLDDPQFRIWPLVWQVLRNILVKAVTAPFALLGSMFEGAEDAQFVDFEPGSPVLSAKASSGLAALAQGLADKPELKLDIPAAAAGPFDADALRDQRFRQALRETAKQDESFDPDALDAGDRRNLLEDLYRQQFGHRAKPPEPPLAAAATDVVGDAAATPEIDLSWSQKRQARAAADIAWLEGELRPRYAVGADELASLGQARAQAVQGALLADGTIDPARVFLSLGASAQPHEGMARMELKLE